MTDRYLARRTARIRPTGSLTLIFGLCGVSVSLAGCQQQQPQKSETKVATAQPADGDPALEGERRAEAAGATLVGKAAPRMRLTTIDGNAIDLGAQYGRRPVYLKFWATWCIPCRQQMPKFERIFEQQGTKIDIIAVNTGFNDDPKRVKAFRTEYGLKMPIVVDDGRLARALNLQVTPQHVIIDRSGTVIFVGNLDGKTLDTALAKAVADTPQRSAVTGPMDVAAPALRVGDSMGDLSALAEHGRPVSIVHPGRPQALLFFSTWCESYLAQSRPESSKACSASRQTAVRLTTQLPQIQWVGVAGGPWSTKQKDLSAYVAETKPKFPVLLDADGNAFRALGIQQIPTVVLVDADGRIVEMIGPKGDIEASVRRFTASRGSRP